ncbi:MAG: hypothetical protein OXI91_06880 [Chloroflexota bacterium]|nr:hypothetical protein [Chloroflexota bacterium]
MIYGYNPTYFLGFLFLFFNFVEDHVQNSVQAFLEAGGLSYGLNLDNFGNAVCIDWMQV